MGGGQSANTTTTQKFEPPEWTQQGWQDAAARSAQLASEPYQQYGMPTVAPLNDLQKSGLDMATDYGMSGSPYGNQARQTGLATMQGGFMGAGPQASAGTNPFAGQNTYLNQSINDTAGNMTQAFARGTAAQNDAAFARAGVYGGSAWEDKQRADATSLANSVGQMGTQARMQDYGMQQNMAQQGIANNLQAQGMNMGAYNQERDRMQSAMGMAPGFSADDMSGIKAVTGAGDAYNAYTQKLLDSSQQQFNNQVNYPQQELQQYLNTLSQVSGTNGGQQSTQSLPGMSPIAGLLGLGAGAYGVSQFFK
jgi:hypothetical protein